MRRTGQPAECGRGNAAGAPGASGTRVSSTSSSDAEKAVFTSLLNQAVLPSSAWKVPNR